MTLNPEHQRSPLLDSSKMALLQHTIDHKGISHNYNQKSIFWDREHVYNENLMLKTRLREMEEINTKTRTRLLRSEKEAAEIVGLSKGKNEMLFRSMSTQHFKEEKKLSVLKWRVDSLKDEEQIKRMLLMKQKVRQLKEQIDRLKTENVQLKKSMKFTRMSELQTQNKELMEQIMRMKKTITDNIKTRQEMFLIFAKEKEDFRVTMRKQIQTRSFLTKELKQAKQDLFNSKTKSPWISQIKKLESENSKLKEELKMGTMSLGPIGYARNQSLTKLEYSASVFSDLGTANLMQNSPPPKHRRQEQLTSLQLLPLKNNTDEFITPVKPSVNVIVPEDFQPLHEMNIVREVTPDTENPKQRRFSDVKEEEIKMEAAQQEQQQRQEEKSQEKEIKKPQNTQKPVASAEKKKENPPEAMEEIYQNEYEQDEYEDLMKEEFEP